MCTRFLNPFWRVRTHQNWIVIGIRMLVKLTAHSGTNARRCFTFDQSIPPLSALPYSFVQLGKGGSRVNYYETVITYVLPYPGLHVTNYLSRNPLTNSLFTIVITVSVFRFSSILFFFLFISMHFFIMLWYENIWPELHSLIGWNTYICLLFSLHLFVI